MKDRNAAELFQPLDILRKELPQLAMPNYRIYTNAKEYTLVAGESALEALRKSGIAHAHKIVCDSIYLQNVLHHLPQATPAQTAIEAAKAMDEVLPEIETPEPAEEPTAPVAATALNNDDIDKLLQS